MTTDAGLAHVVMVDPVLRAVVDRLGPPPPFARPRVPDTLVLLVLEQQLSLDAAAAHHRALRAACGGTVTTASLRSLDDAAYRTAGVSRQKTRTLRALAVAIDDGTLDLDRVAAASDADAVAELTAVHGIGPWTAQCWLLGAEQRPDLLPTGDLALRIGVQEAYGLEARPDAATLTVLAAPWRPHRSAGVRVVWHDYLSRRGRTAPTAG